MAMKTPNQSNLEHMVRGIKKETNAEKLSELVQNFHRQLSEKLENFQRTPNKKSEKKQSQYFWVRLNNAQITNDDEDFYIIKHYVFRFKSIEAKEVLKIDPDYRHVIDRCFNKLERMEQYRVKDAIDYLINLDESLSIYQTTHKRHTIKENPHLIIDLLAKRLQTLGEIPESNVIKVIMALLDLALEIMQLPDGKNWKWLIKIVIVDVLKLCQSLQITEKTEYKKTVVWLNIIFFGYLFSWYQKELDMLSRLSHLISELAIKYKTWTIPSKYVQPMIPTHESKELNILEVSWIIYYRLSMQINKWIMNKESQIVFEYEILNTYKQAITKLKESKPEDSVLMLYQLVSFCHKYDKVSSLCISYTHLSHCFFLLRQSCTSILYLELVCHIAKKRSSTVLEMLAHKQMAMIAACQFEYKTSIFHFSKALEVCTSNKYLEEELFHEIDDIRTCMAEVMAKYKMMEARFSLEDPMKIDFKCTCSMYEH